MFTITQDGAIARLTLDRPEARNAIRTADWLGLAQALDRIAVRRPRVLLIASSRPGSFCAGADLNDVVALADHPERRAPFRQALAMGIERLAAMACPTIAAIDGGCFGAGVALAIACDIRIAGAAARFAVPPARLGIAYPQRDVRRLAALIGPGQAARLLFAAPTIDAGEAARIGLVEQAVADAAPVADAMAAEIAALAPGAIRLLKRAIGGADTDADADRAFEDAFGGDELAAAIAARRDGQPPVFG